MTTVIEGQPSSAEIRRDLAEAGEPVLLAFSRGKDSIAAWLALRDAGVDVVPYHLFQVPGLRFVAESLAYFERRFGCRIIDAPHPTLYRWLSNAVFQPPERLPVIDAAQLPKVTFESVLEAIREDTGLPASTWIADGVRANDSPIRRASFATHGVRKERSRKISVVWDWSVAEVRERIADEGIDLPVDYEWFGRSFDGIDYRFLAPLRGHAPEDFATVLDWFPLADLELFRREVMA